MKTTNLKELGEFKLIDELTQNIETKNETTVLGIGDDAAIIDNKKQTLVSKDLLIEGVHFNLMYYPLQHLGYKSVAVNLSDIYAMNGTPKQILVGLAVSSKFSVEAVKEIYAGIKKACDIYNIDLIGGDTTSSQIGLVISITVLGEAEESKIVKRSGAKSNDLICVSGNLGGAYLGLQVLERERQIFLEDNKIQPDLTGNDYILERQLKPEARKEIIELLDKQGVIPTSMIDVSDGLSSELLHISKNSNVGTSIYADKIPVDPETILKAEEFKMDPIICALHGGEDYELLFTISQSDFDKVKNLDGISIIGHVTDKESGNNLIDSAGNQVGLTAQGWSSFNE